MLDSQTIVGLLRTGVPHFFRPQGWAACGRHSHSRARTRDVLAQLVDTAEAAEAAEMSIRPWRQVELPALMRLYAQRCQRGYGFIERSEAYWRWLISRKAFDQIYVAIHGPDRMELDDNSSPIVGYAFTREDEIVELVCSPEHPLAGPRLLARACGEAMERDQNSVCFHAPPDDPLHALFQQAGGTHVCQEAWQGEVLMARVLEPAKLLRLLCPVLHERAQQRELERPFELGFSVHGAKYRLLLTRRSVKLVAPRLGRSYLTMNDADFTRLLLGHLDIDDAVQAGRVHASTRVAQEAAAILFPRLPLWRPPLDEVAI
jgi:predicted acetyltransferase